MGGARRGGSAPYWWGEYRREDGRRLSVALARSTHMGARETAPIVTTLTNQLQPRCLAMCGVCAGNPDDMALGDVVVADPVYEWDEGKQFPAELKGDIRQFRLNHRWLRAVQDFTPGGCPVTARPAMRTRCCGCWNGCTGARIRGIILRVVGISRNTHGGRGCSNGNRED